MDAARHAVYRPVVVLARHEDSGQNGARRPAPDRSRMTPNAPIVIRTLARRLAWIDTRVTLGAIFCMAVVPIGLLMRVFRDPLDRRLGEERPSVGVRRTPKPL